MIARMNFRRALVFAALCACTGCAPRNWFQSQFVDARTVVGAHVPPFEPATGDPQFANGKLPSADGKKMLEDGYVRIGKSVFTCQDCATGYEEPAKKAAKAVGAAFVIVYQRVEGKSIENRTVLVDTYQFDVEWESETTTQAVSDGEGNVSYENEYSSTPHMKEKYREETRAIQHDQTAYLATFWAKAKPNPLGVFTRRLTKSEIAALNHLGVTAVAVSVVVTGSPAARGGIVEGDFLTAFGDTPIAKATPLHDQITRNAGQHVTVHALHANGSPFTAEITLGAL
jgi:PDZ domain